MADNSDPFADLAAPADTPSLTPDGSPSEPEALTLKDRIVMQTLFDTQPKRRAAYLKQKGWELNPKNDNEIRPLGSKEDFHTEIDPGGIFNINQYLKQKYGEKTGKQPAIKTHVPEFVADAAEGLLDFVGGALIEGFGDVSGLGAGAVTAPTGPGAGLAFLGTRSAARGMAYNTLEKLKDTLGEFYLDKEIPVDWKERGIQTAIQAVGPEVIATGGKALLGGAQKTAQAVGAGFKTLLNLGGGKVDAVVMKALEKDPKLFTDQAALKGAGEGIQSQIDNLFGITAGENVPKSFADVGANSPFKQKMAALEQTRRQVVGQLVNNREADMTVEEVLAPIYGEIERINNMRVKSDTVDKPALKYLKSKAGELLSSVDGNYKAKIMFNDVDQFIQKVQKDSWGKDVEYGPTLRTAIENVNQAAKAHLDPIFQKAGLPNLYADTKAQESQIFKAFEAGRDNINRNNMMKTIIGGIAEGSTGNSARDVTTRKVTSAMSDIDQALGTDFSNQLQTGQMQSQVYNAMQSGRFPTGSAGALTRATTVGGATALATHNPALGVLAGGAAALGGMPQVALPAIAGSAAARDALQAASEQVSRQIPMTAAEYAAQGALEKATRGGINAAELGAVKQLNPITQQNPDDPFADLHSGE